MISIITSLYKSEDFLPDYIKKVEDFYNNLKKKGVNIEFIIIANDISEKERSLLTPLTKTNWVRIIETPRESLYASWNRGVKEAKGENIGFWNVDDIRFPEAVYESEKKLNSDTGLVYFPFIYKRYVSILGIDILTKTKNIIPPPFNKEKFKNSMCAGPFFLFKKTLFNKVGVFDESFKIAGDFDWISRASQVTSFTKIDTMAGIFKNNGKSLSGSKNMLQQKENWKITHKDILSNYFNFPFMDELHSYEDPSGNIRLYHYLKAKRCMNFLTQNASREKTFLDAGAGRGQYCYAAKDIYKKVYCFEYNTEELAKAEKFINSTNVVFKQVDLTDIPLENKSVDKIICSEVLEHIKDNKKAISELYRILKDDGTILLSIPNRFSLFYQKVWMKNKKSWYPKPKDEKIDQYFEARRHLEYPFWKIEALAHSVGFKIIKRQGANIIPLPESLRKKLMYQYPSIFKIYLKTEYLLSSLLPFCSSFYFITLKK